MAVERKQLLDYINNYLEIGKIKDYCPNGLQVEGRAEINTIITGVTASQALIDKAIEQRADLILVHHGYFWKGESQPIVGLKKNRIKALLVNDINLAGYHLPIDVHPEVGNNRQLGELLGLKNIKPIAGIEPLGIVYQGELTQSHTEHELASHIERVLQRTPLAVSGQKSNIKTLAWCTGGGQSFIDAAADYNIDAFISGEVSEQTVHSARELGVAFYAAGHHATERYGIKALGEHLKSHFNVDVQFVDVDNPA